MKASDSLIESIRSLEPEIRNFGVKKLWLFGSAARGEDTFNDLDFLVEFEAPPTFLGFMNLKFFLEDQLQIPVDLHSKSSCPERFFHRIQHDLLDVA
jgi:predicted nucleotidyltransferase